MALIRYKKTELAFTNKRVIAKFGFISRHTVEIYLSKVESLQVSQGIFGRIFDFGTLIISGAGNPRAPIPGIDSPMLLRRLLMEFQDRSGKAL
ncbi:PH domain-containing protein [Aquabacterium sp. NJ1]|uniref:PH domain-containing protein n=1 Tax=Aquabacterium sp. NJ1 TaxID=1538295 RepID=UPI00190F2AD9|nr:PH domain-containing protein [Aquabacterium sp. NJ1]